MKGFVYSVVLVFVLSMCVAFAAGENVPRIQRYAVLGNSFALHPVTYFWWGEWGMAASKRDSDFCHVLHRELTRWQGFEPVASFLNVFGWESDHGSPKQLHRVLQQLSGHEDLIVMRFGECVGNTVGYQENIELLVDSIRYHNPKVLIEISGNFWPNYKREICQEKACKEKGCVWCPLQEYCKPENQSSMNAIVFGEDGIWHKISEGGTVGKSVANHANDRGHRLMAEALFDSIKAAYGRLLDISVVTDDERPIVSTCYYDLSGRAIGKPMYNGVYLRRTTDAAGRRKSHKIIYSSVPR